MNIKISKLVALLLVLCMLLSFASCAKPGNEDENPTSPSASQSGSPDASPSEEPSDGVVPGTTLNYSIVYDLPSQMPWVDNRINTLGSQIYDNLLYKYHGEIDDVRGNLAESWTVSDDGKTWVFQIKQGVEFTSGTALTADCFVKTWDAAQEFQPRYFGAVEKYEATGEYELTVTLNTASPTFIYELPMAPQVGVIDPIALDEFGPEDNRAAIGCGPYMIDSYVPGEKIVLKANPNYHNPDRQPAIETVNFVIVPDENSAVMALMNGQIDCMMTANVEVYKSLLDAGYDPIIIEDRVTPFWFNARDVEVFRDAAVREAICHMIDWDSVNKLAYDGLYRVPDSYYVGPGGAPLDAEKYAYDPDLGLQMLEDAGYSPSDISFKFIANTDNQNMCVIIQEQLRKLGIANIEIEAYDNATAYGMFKAGEWDVYPQHNGYSLESPLTPYTMGLLPDGSQPCMLVEYADEAKYEEAIELYNKAVAAPDFETYVEYVSQITAICQDLCMAFGGLQVMRFFAYSDEFTEMYPQQITGNIEFCYVREAAA